MSTRPSDIAKQRNAISTVGDLAQVFEGISGMHIAKIKNQVLTSQQFFKELWGIYTQIRVDQNFRFGRSQIEAPLAKELLVVITAEGGLSGEIDQKLINLMLKNYNPEKQDIIVIGHHGAVQLVQRGVEFKKYFKLPVKDQNINALPLIKETQLYQKTTVYYQTYVTLMVQDVKRIELVSAIAQQGKSVPAGTEVISEANYIFEPSTYAVVDHLERTMLQIMFGQLILESKLAQYASRFRAMGSASNRAKENVQELDLAFHRAKRNQKDERMHEIINGLKQAAKL